MALYLLTLPTGSTSVTVYDVSSIVVEADDAATARNYAESLYPGPWGAATATTVAAQSADLEGWTCRVRIGPDPTDPDAFEDVVDVSTVGDTADDWDEIGADLVTLLNGTALIGNASYSSPTLTIAAIADGIGDHSVRVEITPPSGTKPVPELVGTITDGGVAAAALTVAFEVQTANPAIIGTTKKTQ